MHVCVWVVNAPCPNTALLAKLWPRVAPHAAFPLFLVRKRSLLFITCWLLFLSKQRRSARHRVLWNPSSHPISPQHQPLPLLIASDHPFPFTFPKEENFHVQLHVFLLRSLHQQFPIIGGSNLWHQQIHRHISVIRSDPELLWHQESSQCRLLHPVRFCFKCSIFCSFKKKKIIDTESCKVTPVKFIIILLCLILGVRAAPQFILYLKRSDLAPPP